MVEYIGNKELLNVTKTAFLASSKIPVDLVLRCYDWATQMAREMYKQIPSEFQPLLDANRLLIISVSKAVRQSKATAYARNKYICEIADSILFVGVTEKSSLYPLRETYEKQSNNDSGVFE